ncbi:MAG: replicative DNA helicase [Ignavibacteriales bacterium]|nr:replicative DNA helicase [Ignavibacteriales bacterium]MCF8437193.1 replicative DNA helicase [Ignavibacteriales bacterium]
MYRLSGNYTIILWAAKMNNMNVDMNKLLSESRKMPANLEVEMKVIGAMLLNKAAIEKSSEILTPECFFDEKNKLIFEAIRSLVNKMIPVDTVSIYEELKNRGQISAVGAGYLAQLSRDISSAATVEYHSRLILEKWTLRKLIETSLQIAGAAYEDRGDVFQLLDEAEKNIFEITKGTSSNTVRTMKEVVNETIELIEAVHSNKITNVGVSSGFVKLDEMLGGFRKSDLIIVAARPAMGKTGFALSCLRNIAVASKEPVAFFSLEMDATQLVTRLISAESRIDAHMIRTGKFKAEEGSRISKTVHRLSDAPAFIDDSAAQTILQIRAKARRLVAEHDVRAIFIDYLQLIESDSRTENREREISNISRSLKALAKELKIPVIALSQLNRAVESTGDKKPMLSHLRESGSIEQDADVVCFLYRPEYYKIMIDPETNESNEGIATVIIAKHRNGPVGEVRLRFFKEYAKFENLDLSFDNLPIPGNKKSQDGDYTF